AYLVHLLGSVWRFLAVFGGVYVLSAVGFYLLEGGRYSWLNSFYWSMVTLGTVGYGDVVPTNGWAKILTIGVVATQIFLLAYLISVIATAVNEETTRRGLGTYGTDLVDHIVVLGYSSVGRAAVRELLAQEQRVAVVTERAEDVPNLRALAGEDLLFATFGSPSERAILERVHLARARSVIVCTDDDATNMIGALNVLAINPKLRVVVSVGRPQLKETLRAAGVTYVTSPSDMGGRLCASAAFEPDVANAIDDLTAADIHSDIQEFIVGPRSPLLGKTFAEADALVRSATGCLIIGVARPSSGREYETEVNPPFDRRLEKDHAVILIGTIENTHRFRKWYGADQGR
ncbi:MAG: potassium channel family protein, partial [Thermoplasmata archaeon]